LSSIAASCSTFSSIMAGTTVSFIAPFLQVLKILKIYTTLKHYYTSGLDRKYYTVEK
jgi:hypothetical protein